MKKGISDAVLYVYAYQRADNLRALSATEVTYVKPYIQHKTLQRRRRIFFSKPMPQGQEH